MMPPLTPAGSDLRGREPPWDMLVELAVETFGIGREKAQAFTDEQRRKYWKDLSNG